MMKKIMWIISFISLAGTALVLPLMPDLVPMHYDAAGNIDRWGSKYENLMLPVFVILITLLFFLMVRFFEKKALHSTFEKEKAEAQSIAKVLGITGVSMAAMFTVMHGFTMYGSYQDAVSGATTWSVDINRVSGYLLGILMIVLGNFITKTRINSVIGVRTDWSMYNDNTWRKSNRVGAWCIMAAGVLTIATCALMENSFFAIMMAVGYLVIAAIIAVAYSYKAYLKELESEKERER